MWLGRVTPHEYQYEKFYFYIPFHLLFLGEVWTFAERPFTADPYWSLSYEAWYYVWFSTLFYFCGWRRVVLFLLVGLIVGYQHWILFPIWLSGVMLYRNADILLLSAVSARIGMILSFAVIVMLEYTGGDLWLWHRSRYLAFPRMAARQYWSVFFRLHRVHVHMCPLILRALCQVGLTIALGNAS